MTDRLHTAASLQPPLRSRWVQVAWVYGPLALCLAVVFALSCTRLKVDMLPFAGITRHVLAFAVIALLFWRVATASRWAWLQRWAGWAAVAGSSLFGALDEYHQTFVRGRDADPADWLVDTLAAAATILILYTVRRWSRQKDTPAGGNEQGPRPVVVDFVRPSQALRRPGLREAVPTRPESGSAPSTWPGRAVCRSASESAREPVGP